MMTLSDQVVAEYKVLLETDPGAVADEEERQKRKQYFQSWTVDRLRCLDRDGLVSIASGLWSTAMWGSKGAFADRIIDENGLELVRERLADLIYGDAPMETRWDKFRATVKHIGPAFASELLAHIYPNDYLVWNKIAISEFQRLGVDKVPRHYYQLDGKTYLRMCSVGKVIADRLRLKGIVGADLMLVNYFLWWHDKHVDDSPTTKPSAPDFIPASTTKKEAEFLHNEVRDKLVEVGGFLGFIANSEVNVAAGSRVDVVWEATIGNMGRVVYVFEVQTKGSIDSLIVNLLKAKNNPAVQGIVAVSDEPQLAKIKAHSTEIPVLNGYLKFWDYREVLSVHESLESAHQKINQLGLVPKGF